MRILFFAPYSEFWIHAFPEALIGEALQAGGHEIKYVTCGRAFEDCCVPMRAHKLTVESGEGDRLRICQACNRNATLLARAFAFQTIALADKLTSEDRAAVRALLADTADEDYQWLSLAGVPVGKIALYETILASKALGTQFNISDKAQYLADLRNTIYTVRAATKIFDSWRPDRVVVYNALYSVNRAVCLLAEARGIPCYFMHAGQNFSRRLQSLILGRGHTFSYMSQLASHWPRFAKLPCTAKQLARVTDHLAELLKARSFLAYSVRKSDVHFDLRDFFGVGTGQKLIVATLSSQDEQMAAILSGAIKPFEGLLFKTQAEWVAALIEYVKSKPDIFLVIRVHPREFPNRRDGRLSQHAEELRSLLSRLPANSAVNWPDQNISIFDFADQADAFLNAWSTAGKDMSMLGIPVVIYSSKLPMYPAELNYLGEDLGSYFAAIDEALRDGWSFERVRLTYRWLVFEFIRSTVDISDSYFEDETPDRSTVQKVYHRLMRTIAPDYKKKGDIRRRSRHLNKTEQVNKMIEAGHFTVLEQELTDRVAGSLAEETRALKSELRRVANLLFGSSSVRNKSRLYRNLTGAP